MKDINLLNIQLSDLELFLNVAEYSSFTKAGERLFMSQSWVSKRISQLEIELGLILFTRNKRKVILTPAGRILYDRLQGVTTDILDAIQLAHAVQTGTTGTLSIGYLEWGTTAFLNVLEPFLRDNPLLSLELLRMDFSNLRTSLSSGRMDLIFTISYDCGQFSSPEYKKHILKKLPLYAYMSKEHPLAKKHEISIYDLRSEPIFMVDQVSSPGYGNYIGSLFDEIDAVPRIARYGTSGGSHIGGVLLNQGILLASEFFLADAMQGAIARVPIQGAEVYTVAVWRSDNPNPLLEMMLNRSIPKPEDPTE